MTEYCPSCSKELTITKTKYHTLEKGEFGMIYASEDTKTLVRKRCKNCGYSDWYVEK